MKTDMVLEMEVGKFYYNKSKLKASGWTDAMIRDLLADVEIKYAPSCSWQPGSPFHLSYFYEDTKVEAIEKTKAFKERKARKRASHDLTPTRRIS